MHNPQISAFSTRITRDPSWSSSQLAAAQEILDALDAHGACPSVVQGEEWAAAQGQARNDYDLLAEVPLWRHSLRVAELIAPLAPSLYRPDLIIVALAHDLGKAPALRGQFYAGRQHATMIDLAIDTLCPSIKRLRNYRRVRAAIADHHRSHYSEPWTGILKKADHSARRSELAEI
jgi:hypothetical protein